MRATTGIRCLIVMAGALALAGCTSAPSADAGQRSAACAAPVIHLTPEVAEPDHPLTIASTGWGPCNDTNEENSAPPWQTVTLEWVQNGETTNLGTVELTNGRFDASITVPSNVAPGEAALNVVTPDPMYEQDFPVTVK